MEKNNKNETADTMFPLIQGLDTKKGIALTGGTIESYRQVLSMFCKDARERLQKFRFYLFESMSGAGDTFPEKYLSPLTTQLQALKTASATIGAGELSAEAAGIEAAGKSGELALIQDKLPGFIEQLTELVNNVRAALEGGQSGEGSELLPGETENADVSGYISI